MTSQNNYEECKSDVRVDPIVYLSDVYNDMISRKSIVEGDCVASLLEHVITELVNSGLGLEIKEAEDVKDIDSDYVIISWPNIILWLEDKEAHIIEQKETQWDTTNVYEIVQIHEITNYILQVLVNNNKNRI
jgi:hypothetical protein